MGVFRRFIDAVGILNGHPGLWTKIYWGDDGKTLHTECGCAWEARGGRLLSLPAAANDDDDSSSSEYPRKTTRPLTAVSPDGARAVCLSGDGGDVDDDDNNGGGGDHHGDEDEPPQSLAADEEYSRLRSRLFLKYQIASGASGVGDGGDGVKSSNQATTIGAGAVDRGRARSKGNDDVIGLFPVYVVTVDPYHQSQPVSRDDIGDDMGRLLAGDSSSDRSSPSPPLTGASEEMALVGGHTARVLVAAWSPSGRRVATAGLDGSICLWDIPGSSTSRADNVRLSAPPSPPLS